METFGSFSRQSTVPGAILSQTEKEPNISLSTLGCTLKAWDMDRLMTGQSPNGVEARISVDQYEDYFSK